ncbi:DUF2066 domain-containing protein [Pseudohaliea rubra]|uniref:DUF2066 domain-containing protein n=1 Tax=Pseudohaliea rubra DSM 19751 TaxID=1265313 RepID=A0A095VV88_9GAMM|nr:DUF2066 domain-containing protein [Pseudohaliea rubra]KGE05275.1 hypothetical protein HRUBRA_00097 [Pseudohaliea rubra DSM 19751]
MRLLFVIATLCVAVLLAPGLRAAVIDNLYQAEVMVDDRGRRALDAAAREGLAAVVLKVTGSDEALALPPVQAALDDASRYLQQYTYREAEDGALSAELLYDETVLRGLLLEAGAPLWTARRPPVLVWLVAEGPGGRDFVRPAHQPGLAEALTEAFARRGVPLRTPLLDLRDSAALGPGPAWRLDAASIAAASARYGLADVLAGRVLPLSSGDWLGDWVYLHDGERLNRAVTASDPAAFAEAGAALAAGAIARRYAVASAGEAAAGGTRVLVLGIDSFAAYAEVMAWFEGLDLVDRVNPELIDGDGLVLRVVARTDLARLAPVIELNERLQPLPAVPDTVRAERAYRWQR